MPHGARKRSKSGYYHVVPKGINEQIIFENDGDRLLYLRLLAKAKQTYGILICAYCLMNNHVHLILEDPRHKISNFIKYVHERYGSTYSRTYDRVGGVFAKTCWSEPIERDEHLLCAVRYVHANPEHAGICKALTYEWSSAKDYLGRDGITDTNMVLDMCGGIDEFIRFSQPRNSTILPFEGSKLRNHIGDDEALRIAKSILGFDPQNLASMNKGDRDRGIALLGQRGFMGRQIARITGVGRGIIQRCLRATGVPPLSCHGGATPLTHVACQRGGTPVA